MKRLMELFISIVILSFSASSQHSRLTVPEAVKSAFDKQFPGNTAKWEKEGIEFEAGFRSKGQEMSALFKSDGTLMETETAIEVESLPQPVRTYVKSIYPKDKIKEASKIVTPTGEITWEAEVKGIDLLFDAAGHFLRKAKD